MTGLQTFPALPWPSTSSRTDPAMTTAAATTTPPTRAGSAPSQARRATSSTSTNSMCTSSPATTAATTTITAAAATTTSILAGLRGPRSDSGFFDADMDTLSVRTFEVRYLRGFQLSAPNGLVNTGTGTPAELSKLARAAVATVSCPPSDLPSGKPAQCVFTLGQLSATDAVDGSDHFDLRVTDVLSMKVLGGIGKGDGSCSAVLVTRGPGESAADMRLVRCHWIEFSNSLHLKGFSMCMNDAFTMAAAAAHHCAVSKLSRSNSEPREPAARHRPVSKLTRSASEPVAKQAPPSRSRSYRDIIDEDFEDSCPLLADTAC